MSEGRLFQRTFFLPLLLIGTGALVFGVSLINPFYFDDLFVLHDNAWLHGLTAPWWWFGTFYIDSNHLFDGFRPTLMNSFRLNAFLFGTEPTSFRFGNIFLHTLNALLLVQLCKTSRNGNKRDLFVWGVAFLFFLHPVQTIGINFLWKRSTILVTTFFLISLITHLRERRADRYRGRIILLQWLLCFLAITTKESGIVLPLLLGVLDVTHFGWRTLLDRRTLWRLYAPICLMACGFYWFRLDFMVEQLAQVRNSLPNRRLIGQADYFLASLATVPKYFGQWITPHPLILDDPLPLTGFPWQGAFLTFLLFGLSLLVAWRFRARYMVPLAIALIWIPLLPTLGVKPVFFVMDQVRLYLPIAGLSVLLLFTLRAASRRIGISPLLPLVALCFIYGSFSLFQNLRYRSPVSIWSDVVSAYPRSGFAWGHLAYVYEQDGRHAEAIRAYELASLVEPEVAGNKISILYNKFLAGYPRELLKQELTELPTSGLDARGTINAAIVAAELGATDRAEHYLLDLTSRNPTYGLAHLNLGILWERKGNNEQAVRAYANAQKLMPNNQRATESFHRLRTKVPGSF